MAEGRERGFLTFEEIAACLEEVDVTKEQVRDLHVHLVDAGVEIVSADGMPPRRRAAATPRAGAPSGRRST